MFTAPRAEPRIILAAALQDLGVVIHPQTNILSVEMANNMNYFCSLMDRIETTVLKPQLHISAVVSQKDDGVKGKDKFNIM